MKRSKPISGRYLGYREADRATPYARFFNPELAPLASHVCAALDRGGVPIDLLPGIDGAAENLFGDTAVLEDGWVLTQDGGMRVSVRTDMPGVTPAMVDWWFGWHGDAPAKYKLWHPQAHVHVGWRETPPAGTSGRARLDDDQQATIVCARLGLGDAPIDIGYLAHHVRAVPGGSEMRSRFWMGGAHVGGRNLVGSLAAAVAKRVLRVTESDARALLVHCGQEMPHLAAFLPALHAEFADDGSAGTNTRMAS
ncbi:MAG: hypothetical protein NTU75_04405 [Sphingomonadales bacterium]|nr:hypothetical protein [Sphingomonadales bacterium]